MRFSNKKAIELAANTIVLLIVGVIILVSALGISYGVFCSAQEYAQDVDSQSQSQLDRLLSSGGEVQVADNTKTAQRSGNALCGSSSSLSATFALGIKNTDTQYDERDFKIQVWDGDVVAANAQHYPPPEDMVSIASRETYTTTILITLDEPVTQQQVYTVRVYDADDTSDTASWDLYGVQQIYINPE